MLPRRYLESGVWPSLGSPFIPPDNSEERGTHLFEVRLPMIFLQGSRDKLADLHVLEPLVMKLGARATLKLLLHADHSFHVGARTGRKDADVRAEMLDELTGWIEKVLKSPEEPRRCHF